MNITPHPPRTLPLLAIAALLLGGGATAAPAQAAAKAKHGVSAKLARGTLTVVGNRRANKITIRLKRRARGTLQVDVGSNGSADFSFKRRRVKRIAVRG